MQAVRYFKKFSLERKPTEAYNSFAMPNQHIVKREDGWAVRPENGQRDTSHHETQKEAIERGREIAINQGSEVVIHDRHGKIRDKDSYGNDPHPPKDQRH